MTREASVERNTKETEIKLKLVLDGTGYSDIETGVGFFDHMLDGFARHGLFDLSVRVHGDLKVDDHHTIEDTGIVLGNAIKEAAGDKKGIRRYGSCILPMDEVLVLCAVDLSGRPYFSWDAEFTSEKIGDMATEMVKEFFYAISYSCGMNLHIKVPVATAIMLPKQCSKALPRHWIRQHLLIQGSQMYFPPREVCKTERIVL